MPSLTLSSPAIASPEPSSPGSANPDAASPEDAGPDLADTGSSCLREAGAGAPGLQIRLAGPDDAAAACHVLRRSISECCVPDHKNDAAILGAWLGNKTPQTVASWFESPTNYSLVALLGGDVVGVSLLTGAGKLALCYLLPEARGMGAGKAMLAKVEETACNWGVKAVQLHSTASGEAFFASQGYIRAGQVRSPYGVDTIFFWKQLDTGGAPDGSQRKRFCNCNAA